jgi:hypothetical protein
MAEHVIRLPDVGEGIAEAELVEWHVKVGDLVRTDTTLAAVMTDKATVEIPSPVDGEIIWLGAEIGDKVAVGSDLVRLRIRGERDTAIAVQPQPRAAAAEAAQLAPAAKLRATEREDHGTPSVVSSMTGRRPVQLAEPRPAPQATARAGAVRPVASPAVRLRAREAGIDLRRVPGTGPAGRITHEDLDAFAARDPRVVRSQALQPKSAVEDVKVIGLRRRIAEQMAVAHARIPHITYVEEVDVTALEELRETLNRRKRKEPRLTLLPFLMRALVLAIAKQPRLNALFDDEGGHSPACGCPYRRCDADIRRAPGASIAPRRIARSVGLRRRGRAACVSLARRHRDARGAVRFDHHDHVTRRHGRRGLDADHQPPRGGDRGREQDHDASGLGRRRLHPAQDDEPVVELRSSRHRRLGCGDLRAVHQGAAGDANADLRERLTPCGTYRAGFW